MGSFFGKPNYRLSLAVAGAMFMGLGGADAISAYASIYSFDFQTNLGNGTVTIDSANFTVNTYGSATFREYIFTNSTFVFNGVNYDEVTFQVYSGANWYDGFNNNQGGDGFYIDAVQSSANGSRVALLERGPSGFISGLDVSDLLLALNSFDLTTDRKITYYPIYPPAVASDYHQETVTSFTAAVPEPASLVLVGSGAASLLLMRRRNAVAGHV